MTILPTNGLAIRPSSISTVGSRSLVAESLRTSPSMLWLDPAVHEKQLSGMLRPFASDDMTAYPIRMLVNSPKNDVPTCIEPVKGSDRAVILKENRPYIEVNDPSQIVEMSDWVVNSRLSRHLSRIRATKIRNPSTTIIPNPAPIAPPKVAPTKACS